MFVIDRLLTHYSKKDIRVVQKNRIIEHLPFLIELYKKLSLAIYKVDFDLDMENVATLDYETAIDLMAIYSTKYSRIWDMVGNIVSSNYKKRSRVAKRIEYIFENSESDVYFGTMTFTNAVLDSTSVKTRRRYVSRFLKSISKDYLANIDFGDKTQREHYHCVFSCKDVELFKQWQYGFVNAKLVRYDKKDISRISKYVVKVINHFVKGSAGYIVASRVKK